jgi:hypothetical protein
MFKNTQVRIAFKPGNTIQPLITNKRHNHNTSGIYEITCNTCKLKYVGQTGRDTSVRHKEHIRYIRNNSNTSAYAMHSLDNRHEYGMAVSTLKLIQPCRKGAHMNGWESLYIHMYREQGKLITEQQAQEHNSLHNLALPPQRYTAVSNRT